MKASRWRLPGALFVVALTIGCDRATKQVAVSVLKGAPPRSFLAGTLRLQYAENAGAFLGLGAGLPEPLRFALFALGNALFLALIAGALLRARAVGTLELLAGSLLLAGGLANLLDRLAGGGVVVDFLNLGVGGLRSGIFNVADVAITTGAVLFLAVSWRRRSGGLSRP